MKIWCKINRSTKTGFLLQNKDSFDDNVSDVMSPKTLPGKASKKSSNFQHFPTRIDRIDMVVKYISFTWQKPTLNKKNRHQKETPFKRSLKRISTKASVYFRD